MGTAEECIPHVIASSSCAGSFFYFAARGDGNCGCPRATVDCSQADNQYSAQVVDLYSRVATAPVQNVYEDLASPPPAYTCFRDENLDVTANLPDYAPMQDVASLSACQDQCSQLDSCEASCTTNLARSHL